MTQPSFYCNLSEVARAYLELGEYSLDLVQVFFGVRRSTPLRAKLGLPGGVGAAG